MPIVIRKKAAQPQSPEPVVKVAPRRGKVLDDMARGRVAANKNMLVPWVLMAGYAYYVHDQSMLSDELFDELMTKLKGSWLSVKHRHKKLIKMEHLKAGTLYDLKEQDYPLLTRDAAASLLKEHLGIKIDVVVV